MALTPYNPIVGVGPVGGGLTAVPAPSVFKWQLQDISAADAGRTEDGKMQKMTIGQVRRLDLSWWGVSTATASQILQAFSQYTYFDVRYIDPMTGGERTGEFYVGDRSAPLWNASMGVWEDISFGIIER